MAFEFLANKLETARQADQFRQIIPTVGGNQCQLIVGDKTLINFSANDYLGLASDPQVIAAANEACAKYGVGSGGSPLVTGHSSLHQDLQAKLCEVTGLENAMLFSSGFAANSGVLATMLGKNDLLLQDKLNHASLMEAGINSPATMKRFKHNDIPHLAHHLYDGKDYHNRLLVSEGVFSMDGDCGDLTSLRQIADKNDAWLMVDDAHGFGVNGQGQGSCAALGVKPDILMATFGKAVGTSGAFVAGNKEVIEYLTNYCRHYIYSTALPISVVGATIKSIELSGEAWRSEKLNERIAYFKQQAAKLGLNLMPSNSAIQPLIIGQSDKALAVSDQLKSLGFWVGAIRPPTVAKGSARLRITLSANHDLSDIDNLLIALARAIEQGGVTT